MCTQKSRNLYLLRTSEYNVFYVVASDPTEAKNLLINTLQKRYGDHANSVAVSAEFIGRNSESEKNVFSVDLII